MEPLSEIKKIEIDQATLKHLNTLRKWSMFLAVTGFISFGLIITLGLITGTFLTAFNYSDKTLGIPDSLVIAGFVGLALVNFFPVWFLYRFSKHTSAAISTLDPKEMYIAIKFLKRYFIFIGILVITGLIVYIGSLILNSAAFLHLFK